VDKLLLITQAKLNVMKLKPGLVTFHVIQPGNKTATIVQLARPTQGAGYSNTT